MQSLTNVERVLKAINRQEPDMVPTFEIDIDQRVINAIKPGLSYEDFCEYMDLDAICYHELRTVKYEVIDEAKGVVRDQWGAIRQRTGASQLNPMLVEPAIKSKKDLDTYVGSDPDLPSRYIEIEAAVRRFKGRRAIIAGVRPFFTVSDSLRAQDDLFRDMIRDPEMVERINEIVNNYYMRYV